MNELKKINLCRKAILFLIPSNFRDKLRRIFFEEFRRLFLLDYLRNLGLLTCKNYIGVNFANAELYFNKNYRKIEIQKIFEADKIMPAMYIEGENLEDIQSFTATTETVLVNISDTKFSFRNNHLIDKDLNVIGEFRTDKLHKIRPLSICYQILSKPIELRGTIAYLSDPSPTNYYHWMCRVLPLLKIYQDFCNLREIDFFYVGKFSFSSFHQESLQQIEIPINKVIQESCSADRLLMAISNRAIDVNDPINRKSYHFSRDIFYREFNGDSGKNELRIYVTRGMVARRKIINEAQVIDLLKKYGFKAVAMDDKTIQEQADLFSQAEVIVAAHGAALTNLLFISPDTKVIELMPYGYVNNCFYVLASHGKADYFCLQSEKPGYSPEGDSRFFDLHINIQKLDKICKMINL